MKRFATVILAAILSAAAFPSLAQAQAGGLKKVASGLKETAPASGGGSGDVTGVTVTGIRPVTVSGSPCTTGACSFGLGLTGVTLGGDGGGNEWHFAVSVPGVEGLGYQWGITPTSGGYPANDMVFGLDGLRLTGDYSEIHGYRKIAVHKPADSSGNGFCFQDGVTNVCIGYDWGSGNIQFNGPIELLAAPLPITSGGNGQAVFEPHQVLVGPATGAAPDDNNYPTVRALVAADLPAMTLAGTVAARPAAGVAGRLYFPSDGVYLYRDNGTTWDAYVDGFRLAYPLDTSSWSWDNQGTATVSTAVGTTTLGAPIGIGDMLHLRYKTAPATPYTITMLYEASSAKGLGTANAVLGCREAATGKIKYLQVGWSGGFAAIVQHFNTAAGPWNSNRVSTPVGVWSTPLSRQWMRFEDNGTNNIYSLSRDGRTWQVIGSESRTANFTCDQVHVGIQAESASDDWDQSVTILSYREQ